MKRIHSQIRLVFLIFFFISKTYANTLYPFTHQNDAERFNTLTKEIRCLVCQNQTIAESYAPLANDLRKKIYRMVLEKKSNEEIKQYLVKRYGEFILLQPPLNKLTLILWIFPFIGLVILFIFFIARVSIIQFQLER